jgi:hypothetical protein
MPREAIISGNPLRDEIRSGRATRETKLDVCTNAISLPSAFRIEVLSILAADPDETIREKAARALQTQPLGTVLEALAGADAAPEMFAYCAAEFPRRPGVADALAKNPTCPIEVLRPVVRYLSVSAVQELFEDLDRLSTSPLLVEAMIDSSVVTAEQRNQLLELQMQEPAGIDAFVEGAEEIEPDQAKRETLLQKLSRLRVVERVQMALKGTREARVLLIRDPCKIVQRAVLLSSQLTDREVESFAGMTTLSDETLRLIATNRKFRKNYIITRTLLNNPKTPLDVSLHMLPAVNPQDLKQLTTNKNIPETLRTTAMRLQRQRTYQRQSS